MPLSDWLSGQPLSLLALGFLACALVIGVVGVRLTREAERFAYVSGLGQAATGAVVLGAITSLPGMATSFTAAAGGHPDLAVSNALGGIAAQTLFLVAADVAYRKTNLEYAAAEEANLSQAVVLIALLVLPILAMAGPDLHLGSAGTLAVHPVTPLLIAGYLAGLRLTAGSHRRPQWQPVLAPAADSEKRPERPRRGELVALVLRLVAMGAVVGLMGWLLSGLAVAATTRTGLSETAAGSTFTAIATSLPELVTALAAIRRGALGLAVGDILGGNAFDVLFVAGSDLLYVEGSLYHAVEPRQIFLVALSIFMVALLLLGLLRREKHGIGNIGFESVMILLAYFAGMALLIAG
ncbi:MAG: sodium:calcium antiporter [Tistlia sp.]|uniref:sodium:calcium antiporter n=1 Tax=Tistlia sp. TaxID=3057121 RepID=UPI0034A54F06